MRKTGGAAGRRKYTELQLSESAGIRRIETERLRKLYIKHHLERTPKDIKTAHLPSTGWSPRPKSKTKSMLGRGGPVSTS